MWLKLMIVSSDNGGGKGDGVETLKEWRKREKSFFEKIESLKINTWFVCELFYLLSWQNSFLHFSPDLST